MNADEFTAVYDRLGKNLEEIKELTKKPEAFTAPGSDRIVEKTRYLFHSAAKSLVDIGHDIILEHDYREPLNRADIFISLAERDIILSSVVPGVKKAILVLPKINAITPSELLEIITLSLTDIHKCLDSFAVYFNLKDK